MTFVFYFLVLAALVLLTLYAYVDRLYIEMGKFFLLGVEDNLEVFERDVEPYLKLDRGRASLTFAFLTQTMILLLAVMAGHRAFAYGAVSTGGVVQAVVLLILAVLVFAHLVPHVLITRTVGTWLIPLRPVLRLSAILARPIVGILSFSFSVATLGSDQHQAGQATTPSEHLEQIIERSEEQGLIAEDDRRLIQSAVEFGDKTVRETMTPRPNIVAVDKNVTLAELLEIIESKPYSRIPVYEGTLDNIIGFVYTRDLIQLDDEELKHLRAEEQLHPVLFVPETKAASELLREMQQQKIHMAVVIDEYGSVAGLATIEDLVEELVGEIHDEAETPADVQKESDDSYIVAGHVDIDRLAEWFGVRPEVPGDAATIAGLVNALAGHVPQAGELIHYNGLEFEILASNDLRVERLRVRAAEPHPPRIGNSGVNGNSREARPARREYRG